MLLLSLCNLFALREVSSEKLEHDSDVLLKEYYNEKQLDSYSEQYWNDIKVSLITLSKGKELTSWFGHSGICIDFPDGYTSYIFDYGRFSFETQTVFDFFKGYLWYWCGASSKASVLEEAKAEERIVSQVELNLTAKQKKAMFDFVSENCDDNLKMFFYKPLTDNCSTRIRDVINQATNGSFKIWANNHEGVSFRLQIRNTMKNYPLALWFCDFIQGQRADIKTTQWDEMFLPVNLEKGVLSYSNLANERTILYQPEETEESIGFIKSLPSVYVYIAASLILVVLSAALFHWQKAWSVFTFIVLFVSALLGIIIFIGMTFTYHEFFWNNENIFLANPLLLIVAFFSFKRDKHQTVLKVFYSLFSFIAVVLLGLKLVLPGIFFQNNWFQLIIYIPFYVVNSLLLSKLKKTGLDSVETSAAEDSKPLK